MVLGAGGLSEVSGGVHSLSVSCASYCYTSLCRVVLMMRSNREMGRREDLEEEYSQVVASLYAQAGGVCKC